MYGRESKSYSFENRSQAAQRQLIQYNKRSQQRLLNPGTWVCTIKGEVKTSMGGELGSEVLQVMLRSQVDVRTELYISIDCSFVFNLEKYPGGEGQCPSGQPVQI
jgi:hypothetical protein